MRALRNALLGALEWGTVGLLIGLEWWWAALVALLAVFAINAYLCSWTHARRACAAERRKRASHA